jgi:catalase
MIGNLVADLSHVTNPAIQRRAIENLRQTDEDLAASVAEGLGL